MKRKELLSKVKTNQIIYDKNDVVIIRIDKYKQYCDLFKRKYIDPTKAKSYWQQDMKYGIYTQYIIYDFNRPKSNNFIVSVIVDENGNYVRGHDNKCKTIPYADGDTYIDKYRKHLLGKCKIDPTSKKLKRYLQVRNNIASAENLIDSLDMDQLVKHDIKKDVVIIRINSFEQYEKIYCIFTGRKKVRKDFEEYITNNDINTFYVIFYFEQVSDRMQYYINVSVKNNGKYDSIVDDFPYVTKYKKYFTVR